VTIRRSIRNVLVLIIAVVVLQFTSGCAVSVTTEGIGSCSPSYEIGREGAGRISIQQAGRGQVIQWGLYVDAPYKVGTQFVVRVKADGTVIDGKNQNYEPHGSISPARASKYSGKLLEITGTATHGQDQLAFSAKCTIA
jgi:hypothetical protein